MPDGISNGIWWKACTMKCCIQKLVKKLETRGSRSNACRLLSLGPIERQSVQKYTPHNRTTQRRYTPRDSSRQCRHFGKSIPWFGETHSSVLGCERRPVSASIMSRSCFASFPICVYKFSSHYLPPPPNASTCPFGIRGLPSWAWQKCNRLSEVGTPMRLRYVVPMMWMVI